MGVRSIALVGSLYFDPKQAAGFVDIMAPGRIDRRWVFENHTEYLFPSNTEVNFVGGSRKILLLEDDVPKLLRVIKKKDGKYELTISVLDPILPRKATITKIVFGHGGGQYDFRK